MRAAAAIAILAAAACGGSSKKPATTVATDKTVEEAPPPVVEPEPEPEPPPPPQEWKASAALTPVKGAKVKAVTIAFAQTEGQATSASSEAIAGLKAGTYHLAIHEGGDCGKKAAGAGAIWADAGAALTLTVERGVAPMVALAETELQLAGEQSIVGKTLVLHADKRGKPAAAMACGVIVGADTGADADADADADAAGDGD